MTRMLIARILVVLATLFAVVGLLAGYVRYQALDNETFSNTAADLIADDEIRDQIGLSLVDALYSNVDVAAALEARLPRGSEGARRADRRRRQGARRPRRPSACSSARGRRSSGCGRSRRRTSSCCACSTTT